MLEKYRPSQREGLNHPSLDVCACISRTSNSVHGRSIFSPPLPNCNPWPCLLCMHTQKNGTGTQLRPHVNTVLWHYPARTWTYDQSAQVELVRAHVLSVFVISIWILHMSPSTLINTIVLLGKSHITVCMWWLLEWADVIPQASQCLFPNGAFCLPL